MRVHYARVICRPAVRSAHQTEKYKYWVGAVTQQVTVACIRARACIITLEGLGIGMCTRSYVN